MSTPEQGPSKTQVQDPPDQPVIEGPTGPDLTGIVLLDRYRVLRKLGAGGMGTVYLGEHTTIGKKFAIKVLGNEYAHRRDLVERFLQEARAASMITQQNVVEITDYGDTPDGSVFFVMEFLDGEDLGGTLTREGRLPWSRVRHVIMQVCRALEAAHAAGIVHRDMKPDNCFRITRGKDSDFIKVLDFGIAKVQSGESGGKGLTQTGMIFGTPEYMSPEQAQGDKIDHRADIYAVGVIMYQLLTGKQPFTGPSFMAVLTKHMFEIPRAPSEVTPEAEILPEVEAIVLKAMQKDRSFRFQTMAELIAAIEQIGTGAGAVEVVQETLARPSAGPTSFAARATNIDTRGMDTRGPSTSPELAPSQDKPRGRGGLWIGLGVVATIAAVATAMFFMGPGRAEPKPEPVAEAPAAPAPVEPVAVAAPPEPAPTPAPEPADTRVTLHFDTNVAAQILDGADRAIYGRTDDESGFELPLSEDSVSLILVAEGYEELAIDVVPNRENKRYKYELSKISSGSGKRRPAASKPAAAAPEPEPAPTAPQPSKGRPDGDLKNPFAK